MTSAGAIDAIRDQLIWDRLLAIVEEQAQTLIRTAFSTTVREAGDLSAGVFSVEGAMLAQAVTGTPGHVNAMAAAVATFLARFPAADLAPGDVLVTNDPWQGTGHLNDFTVVTPVFRGGTCVALFAATSHIADVGGRGFGPDGREVYEEGINIPLGYLFRGGEADATLFRILRANVRDPAAAEGDLFSLTACNEAAGRRLADMMDEFALDELDAVAATIITNSRAAMLDEIRALPAGTWRHHMRIDGYDTPIDLHCALTIGADGIGVDFSGTSAVSGYGINVPLTYTQAYASFGVRCVVGNDVPNNAGSLDVVSVRAPAGCILNAPPPCPVSARHAVGQMLPDVVLGCLDVPLGGQVPAEGASCLFNPVFLGHWAEPGEAGGPPARRFVINPFYTGGSGARPDKDGLSTTAFPSGVRNTPTEINEATSPLIIWQKEYRSDSGGAGRYRGGLGQRMEFGHAAGLPFTVSKMFDRCEHAPRGRHGGQPGATARVMLDGGATLRGMGRDTVPAGATLIIDTPGGGGRGDPRERDGGRLAADLRNGLVSPAGAQRDYGLDADAVQRLVDSTESDIDA